MSPLRFSCLSPPDPAAHLARIYAIVASASKRSRTEGFRSRLPNQRPIAQLEKWHRPRTPSKLRFDTEGPLAAPPDALHYAGKDVKLGTPNRPILWIERKRDGRCMVIYADLSVKDVPAEEAPTVPQSEGSPTP